ncbi:MAG: tRNA (adenosine(37)-N6)-threonylcarbamoyltransferase complex dimerization subunit type 1 TsaB, partial [Bacteroidia bacterium]|nr:tRNA (adenosine(37)-N6)-threonylcarbamoyltransferase complex dimerization subunit type 1 TsaB [Bacteroidia bacterium]
MYFLGIESATDACSVVLYKNEQLIDIKYTEKPKTHSQYLTTFIEHLLQKNRISVELLSAIAVSAGPGSFTGLRIGMSTAKGMAYALDIPLILIPSTTVAAYSGLEYLSKCSAIVAGIVDAPYQEIYVQFFELKNNELIPCSDPKHFVVSHDTLLPYLEPNKTLYLIGKGADKVKSYYKDNFEVVAIETEQNMKNLGNWLLDAYHAKNFADLDLAQPLYI